MRWTMTLPDDFVLAPDRSEIRPLLEVARGGMAHCTLPPGGVSLAVRHKTIEEIWYFLGGRGQVWRRLGEVEEVVDVAPGACLCIPTGAHFQFRNTGAEPLVFVIATMPPWPGMDEAVRVEDHWPPA
ncbi:MAG: cupin domain-containing protein [Kiloniellaceae bacterium]